MTRIPRCCSRRASTDPQDGLLRTRMVKFSSRAATRARGASDQSQRRKAGRPQVITGGGEDMDRAILERMMSPLGTPAAQRGVSRHRGCQYPAGQWQACPGPDTLHLAREGSDVVLTLADDGAGLDRARIRAKTVERGLLDEDAAVDDDDRISSSCNMGSRPRRSWSVSGRGSAWMSYLPRSNSSVARWRLIRSPGAVPDSRSACHSRWRSPIRCW